MSADRASGVSYIGPQAPRVKQTGQKEKAQRERARKERTSYRTKNNTKEYHIHVGRSGGGSAAPTDLGKSAGIGDLRSVSAGGLRDICERGRKVMREAASDIAYAEEVIRNALREVPPAPGEGRSVQWQRANRVARNLKRAANAAQASSAHMARTWHAYTKEYERELAAFGGPRQKPRQVMDFRI